MHVALPSTDPAPRLTPLVAPGPAPTCCGPPALGTALANVGVSTTGQLPATAPSDRGQHDSMMNWSTPWVSQNYLEGKATQNSIAHTDVSLCKVLLHSTCSTLPFLAAV